MSEVAPSSTCAKHASRPKLADLHLWRVQPRKASLFKRIPPSKRQKPIVMTAVRMSGRKVVIGIWAVADGEAFFVSFYDPKAVETLDLTIVCGWWAELGLPPVITMSRNDKDGLAAYVNQGLSLNVPQPDHKGRVDMSKASVDFRLGPPPPPFEFDRERFGPRLLGVAEADASTTTMTRRVVWKGLRRFGSRAVLLACARDGPSVMLVRGWDSSNSWRMTNVITFHEADWRLWMEAEDIGMVRSFTSKLRGNPAGTNSTAGFKGGKTVDVDDGGPSPRSVTDQASTDRLCQAIADRVEVRREGSGGNIALREPRRGAASGTGTRKAEGVFDGQYDDTRDGDDESFYGGSGRPESVGLLGGIGAGMGSIEAEQAGKPNTGEDLSRQRAFLSFRAMDERLKDLDKDRYDLPGDVAIGTEPRRPVEALDAVSETMTYGLPEARSLRAYTRRRGADGKLRSMDEVVEQLRTAAKREEDIAAKRREKAVEQWKFLGKILCRLLRMSDYWYGFASDNTLSTEERVSRRISILQEMVEIRLGGGGKATIRSLVRVFAERYPRPVWSRFRQLMRQPKSQRCRRDMSVCAVLLSDIDNPFFRNTAAGLPFSRLVDLATDARLTEKSAFSVLYEEGEATPREIGGEQIELAGAQSEVHRTRSGNTASGNTDARQARGMREGLEREKGKVMALKQTGATDWVQEDRWTAGAYVVMHGSVDLYVLERRAMAGLPTVASQESLATKATHGQPMSRTWPQTAPNPQGSAGGDARATCNGTSAVGPQDWPLVDGDPSAIMLAGTGSGPRRMRTKNMAPRWKACRLGPGALFGHRRQHTIPTSPDTPCITGSYAKPQRCGPALETAVAAEKTELLEIGVDAYASLLANGVREGVERAVEVLQATKVLDGVPTAALERICRYATDRTSGAIAEGTTRAHLHNQEVLAPKCNRRTRPNTVCRKGAFQTTAYFIAEGQADVVIDDPCPAPAGGSVSSFFRSDDRGRILRERHRRRKNHPTRRGAGMSVGGPADSLAPRERSSWGHDAAAFVAYPTIARTPTRESAREDLALRANEDAERAASQPSLGEQVMARGQRRCMSVSPVAVGGLSSSSSGDDWWGPSRDDKSTPAAVLTRGDFFGVVPEDLCADGVESGTKAEAVAGAPAKQASTDASQGKSTRPHVTATPDPPAITEPPFAQSPLDFPSLHKASLLAGPAGVRCLVVRLQVLQKVCPEVYLRLTRAASHRYTQWMQEAKTRDEDSWNELLESGSVHSLSKSFYKSFARKHCSGHTTDTTPTVGCTSSVDDTTLDGPSASRSLAGCGAWDGSVSGENHTVGGFLPSRSFRARESIFNVGRRFRHLTSCSSAKTVIPVKLGRSLPRSIAHAHATPVRPPGRVGGRRKREALRYRENPHATRLAAGVSKSSDPVGHRTPEPADVEPATESATDAGVRGSGAPSDDVLAIGGPVADPTEPGRSRSREGGPGFESSKQKGAPSAWAEPESSSRDDVITAAGDDNASTEPDGANRTRRKRRQHWREPRDYPVSPFQGRPLCPGLVDTSLASPADFYLASQAQVSACLEATAHEDVTERRGSLSGRSGAPTICTPSPSDGPGQVSLLRTPEKTAASNCSRQKHLKSRWFTRVSRRGKQRGATRSSAGLKAEKRRPVPPPAAR